MCHDLFRGFLICGGILQCLRAVLLRPFDIARALQHDAQIGIGFPASGIARDRAFKRLDRRGFITERLLRDPEQRAVIHQLDRAIRRLQESGQLPDDQTELTNVYHTPMRMWGEP